MMLIDEVDGVYLFLVSRILVREEYLFIILVGYIILGIIVSWLVFYIIICGFRYVFVFFSVIVFGDREILGYR